MCLSRLIWKHRSRLEEFSAANDGVRTLDLSGATSADQQMYQQYKKRNSFGIKPEAKLYRIFQKDYYDGDVKDGYLTLPRASAAVWNDVLENPLSNLMEPDAVTGLPIHFGALVSSFYAMCWTKRRRVTQTDWDSFSHGKQAIRISTTAGKLMDRVMSVVDPYYMNRSWLIEVEYKNPCLIRQMQNIDELKNRMESTGALLALSAAVVRTRFSGEQEVRLLYDHGGNPQQTGIICSTNPDLVRIPFDWNNFVESSEIYP